MPTTMQEATAAIRRMFDSEGWKYDFDADELAFTISFRLEKTKLSNIRICIRCKPYRQDPALCQWISTFAYIPLVADEECRLTVCEYLMRVNYRLSMGNFEMDFSDGEISFRQTFNVLDGMIGDDALDDLTTLPVSMFEKYGNGLISVMMGAATPEEALKKAQDENG